jgi:hypothetical protein
MQPVRYSIGITLDGCIDHQVGLPDAHTHAHATEWIASGDHLVFGRITYGLMEFWRPLAEGRVPEGFPEWMVPFAHAITRAKKYVVSDTLPGRSHRSHLPASALIPLHFVMERRRGVHRLLAMNREISTWPGNSDASTPTSASRMTR